MASFFDPSIQCIIESVEEQRSKAHKQFTVSFPQLSLSIHNGRLSFFDSMSFLLEALLLATGSINKSLKL